MLDINVERHNINDTIAELLDLMNFIIAPYYNPSIGHTHPRLEMSVVKVGRGIYNVEDTMYPMQPGDVFLFNNIERHGIIEVEAPGPMVNLTVHFEPSFVYASERDFFDLRFLKVFFERNENFQNRLDRNNPYTQQVGKLLLDMEEEFLTKKPGFELAVKVKLLDILLLLFRHFNIISEGTASDVEQKSMIDAVKAVIHYVNANYFEDLTLEKLARQVNLNAAYLSSVFTKYNGISLWSYVNKTRVARAMEKLKATDKSVIEIANTCGFNNVSNFNRIFKRITGLSPSGYRKNSFDI